MLSTNKGTEIGQELFLIHIRNSRVLLPYMCLPLAGVLAMYFIMYGMPRDIHLITSGFMFMFSLALWMRSVHVERLILGRYPPTREKGIIKARWVATLIAYKVLALTCFLLPLFNFMFVHSFYDQLLGFMISAFMLFIFSSSSSSFLPLFCAQILVITMIAMANAFLFLEFEENKLVPLFLVVMIAMSALIGLRNWNTARNLLQQQLALKDAVRIADASQKAKSDFIAALSHEIRTPLNGIMGMIHFLREAPLEREQRESVEVIYNCSGALLNTLNDVLDMSKMEAGKFSLDYINFDMGHFLKNIQKLMSSRAREKGISLTLNIDQGIDKYIHGDPHRLQQVLMNLVNNAVKFTAEGGVTINAVKKRGAEQILRFEVVDTGAGISPEAQKKLFSNYVQADSSVSRNYGGTGLGLSIAKRLVGLMNGEIGLISEVGKGSTFWFEIPFVAAIQTDEKVDEDKESISFNASGFSVLVAEDNEINQIIISKFLERYNFSFDIVPNGADAIVAASRKDYHLIFMDMQMPVMDGPSAARALKSGNADGRNINTPIIGLTGNIMKEHIDECLKAGMVDHIAKPLDLRLLLKKIIPYLPEDQRETIPDAMIIPQGGMLDELRSVMGADYVLDFIGQANGNIKLLVKQMDSAYQAHSFTKMADYAHDLKSVAGSIDRFDISDSAQRLERLARKPEQDRTSAHEREMKDLVRSIEIASGINIERHTTFPLSPVSAER